MAQNKFRGLGIALVTPFQADGSIDFDALDRLIEYQIQGGADFLCIMGTTAETPTLSREEKRLLKEHFVERVAGRVPLLMGCGGNNTAAILEELQTENWKGIDGILSVCPYYNKPTQEGLYQHFAAIAKTSPVPVVLYNVPGRTGVNMTAETTLRLAREFENIVAIKEASGNITQMDDIIKNKPKHFDVISGDDGITFPLITLGAVGVISVIGNALPAEFSRMVRLALKGEYNTSLSIHHKFTELFKLLFVDGNPAGVKAMLSEMGLIQNVPRLPLIPTRLTTMEKISQIVRDLGY
ncbi:MAG: 4-hydroxy-tetrahydrodipicolinate synthase [Bacteroidaceae bacterium]|nr:4-hydroxy-tetrahydrodipicolinate synthase [Bacteroidaceae bacterium]